MPSEQIDSCPATQAHIARPVNGARRMLAVMAFGAVAAGAYLLGYTRNHSELLNAPAAAGAGGFVGFDPAEIDIGEHPWGLTIPVTLAFLNLGGEPVTVASADTSCGCLVFEEANVIGRTVASGEVLEFDVLLDTERLPGRKRRSVTIASSSGQKFTARILIDVESTFEITPDTVDFGDVVLDAEGGAAAHAIRFESATHKVTEVVADSPWLVTAIADRAPGESEILLELVRSKLPYGRSTANVKIYTTDTAVPPSVVVVKVSAVGDLRPTLRRVFLRGEAPGQVRFSTPAGGFARIVEARTDNPAISAIVLDDGVTVDIRNRSGELLPSSTAVRVVDDRGQTAQVLVSTFPGD